MVGKRVENVLSGCAEKIKRAVGTALVFALAIVVFETIRMSSTSSSSPPTSPDATPTRPPRAATATPLPSYEKLLQNLGLKLQHTPPESIELALTQEAARKILAAISAITEDPISLPDLDQNCEELQSLHAGWASGVSAQYAGSTWNLNAYCLGKAANGDVYYAITDIEHGAWQVKEILFGTPGNYDSILLKTPITLQAQDISAIGLDHTQNNNAQAQQTVESISSATEIPISTPENEFPTTTPTAVSNPVPLAPIETPIAEYKPVITVLKDVAWDIPESVSIKNPDGTYYKGPFKEQECMVGDFKYKCVPVFDRTTGAVLYVSSTSHAIYIFRIISWSNNDRGEMIPVWGNLQNEIARIVPKSMPKPEIVFDPEQTIENRDVGAYPSIEVTINLLGQQVQKNVRIVPPVIDGRVYEVQRRQYGNDPGKDMFFSIDPNGLEKNLILVSDGIRLRWDVWGETSGEIVTALRKNDGTWNVDIYGKMIADKEFLKIQELQYFVIRILFWVLLQLDQGLVEDLKGKMKTKWKWIDVLYLASALDVIHGSTYINPILTSEVVVTWLLTLVFPYIRGIVENPVIKAAKTIRKEQEKAKKGKGSMKTDGLIKIGDGFE